MAYLTVHYHRRNRDYGGWQLCATSTGAGGSRRALVHPQVAPPRTPPESAFGVVFRVALPELFADPRDLSAERDPAAPLRVALTPRTPARAHEDRPERVVDIVALAQHQGAWAGSLGSDHCNLHVYIAEACAHAHASPLLFTMPDHTPRFLGLAVDVAAAPLTALPDFNPAAESPCPEALSRRPRVFVLAQPNVASRAQESRTPRSSEPLVVADELFPAPAHAARADTVSDDPELVIVDRADFGNNVLHFLVVQPGGPIPFVKDEYIHHHWFADDWIPFDRIDLAKLPTWSPKDPGSQQLSLVPGACAVFPVDDAPTYVESELSMQADAIPGCCRVVPGSQRTTARALSDSPRTSGPSGSRGTQALTAPDEKTRVLVIRYIALGGNTDGYTMRATGAVRTNIVPLVTRLREAESGPENAIFEIDLGLYSAYELRQGLKLSPTQEASGNAIGPSPLWEPHMGLNLALCEGSSVLVADSATTLSLEYHRFGSVKDLDDWELHIWIDDARSGTALSTYVKPRAKKSHDGAAVFDLACLVGFDPEEEIHMQPVKMALVPGHWTENPETGERTQGEPYRDSILRDVIRKWKRRDFEGRSQLHIVQGDTGVLEQRPSVEEIAAKRYWIVEYCRFQADDYDGWDLWTWEDGEVKSNGCALQPVPKASDSTSGVVGKLFYIDRAAYGGGSQIRVVPRRGGDSWTEKDGLPKLLQSDWVEKSRVIPRIQRGAQDVLGPSKIVTIVQGSCHVLHSIEDTKSMLDAFTEETNRVVVRSVVPFEWVNKEAMTRTDFGLRVVVLDRDAKSVLQAGGNEALEKAIRGKRSVMLRKVERRSETELVGMTNSIDEFEEDFLVENAVASLQGFHSCSMHWQLHENWDDYFYGGTLGWDYTPSRCIFRCFAPAATDVYVVLYETATGGEGERISMRRIPEGCWKLTVHRDLRGKYYKLLAEGENKLMFPGVEVIDPYSRCNTSHTGRGLIFGEERTAVAPRPDVKPEHTIVYELHIRDATVDDASGVEHRGKYLGLTEHGTRLRGNVSTKVAEEAGGSGDLTTALDHIVEMGVTAVQIMPVQDFDNDESNEFAYRWGYMPVHFNSPDGWYASETTSVARITEFKKLVDALHRAGLKVIMDVVYNHTAEDGNELNLDARFSFNGLAPRYYYRNCLNTPIAYTGDSTCGKREGRPDGENCGTCVSNGSGCGNEFRSESPMGRKFIVDSLRYWVEEYKVDGFRFDLLGLIDVDTLTFASTELKAIDPNIVLYGEPWCGGLTPIRWTDKGMQRSRGFGVFNNSFRDALRGSPFGIEETFVMDGGRVDEVKRGIIGSIDDFTDSPLETINYVECHDNYTLWDHMHFYIRQRTDDIEFTDADVERMHRLAATIVFTSQGIPMMQIGQEMCRTKFGEENSYESPDSVNMIRWSTKRERLSTVNFYKGLIHLRRSHPELFCMKHADAVRSSVTFYEDLGLEVAPRCIAYRIEASARASSMLRADSQRRLGVRGDELDELVAQWHAVVVLLNPNPLDIEFALPEKDALQFWIPIVDAKVAGVDDCASPSSGSVWVSGRCAMVLRRASERENRVALVPSRLDHITDACETPSDDVVSPFMVGLASHRTPEELEAHERLVAERERFMEGAPP